MPAGAATRGPVRVPRRVLVVGAHPGRGHALARLTTLVADAWRENGAEVDVVTAPDNLSRRIPSGGAADHLAAAETATWLPRLLRRLPQGVDLVQVVDLADLPYLSSLHGRRASDRIPVSALCHDLSLLAEAETTGHSRPLRRFRARGVLRGLERVNHLVATSRYTADALEMITGRRAQVLHPPVDPALTERPIRPDPSPPWPYLLTVAGSGPAGRRSAAITAWTQLRRTPHLDGASLVVVGPPLDAHEEALVTACGGHVSVLTDINDAQLTSLYARCRALLALGRPRGFVWPIAEAHQSGRPVLATDHEVFAETGGAGCVYLPVEGIGQFDAATWNCIAEDLCAPVVADRGSVNAGRFAWHRFVDQLPAKAFPAEDDAGSAGATAPEPAVRQPGPVVAPFVVPRTIRIPDGVPMPSTYGCVLAGVNPAAARYLPPPELLDPPAPENTDPNAGAAGLSTPGTTTETIDVERVSSELGQVTTGAPTRPDTVTTPR